MRRLHCCLLALLAGCGMSTDPETIAIDTDEGSVLAFDLAPDGGSIVFDLLGQLWTVPAAGGTARALTDAVRDTAEDLDPSISPDHKSVVFRAERAGRTGLWLLDLESRSIKQLTQRDHPDEYEGGASWSPDGRTIAFTHVTQDSAGTWHSGIGLIDVASGAMRSLQLDKTQKLEARDPTWTRDGRQIAFVAASAGDPEGGALWIVDANGGRATPLSHDRSQVIAPAFSPDRKRIAFLARDSASRLQVYVHDLAGARASTPVRLTRHDDVASTRVRWSHDGSSIVYAADGKLQRIDARGGVPAVIPFRAQLSIVRPRQRNMPARLVEPGQRAPARAFLGLALSPDAQSIAAITLGKLWIIPVGGTPRSITDVPFSARGLSWSPDGREVAWSAGKFGEEDLFACDVQTGAIRKLTALPGREALPSYSPDGRYIAFMHEHKAGALRVIDARATAPVADTMQARALGPGTVPWTRTVDTYPQWSPASDAVLQVGDFVMGKPTLAFLVQLNGTRDTIRQFVDAPVFPQWQKSGALTYVRHDRLWRAEFDGRSVRGQPLPLGDDAALYASSANDGSILYISEDGLRLRSPTGTVRRLGWPLEYTAPVASALLIRNARIIDGLGNPATAPSDILIEDGRIARIAPGASIKSNAQVIDATGQFVMPGLMDLHAHVYRPELLPGFLYFGVTTLRDQGAAMAPLVAYNDGFSAGVIAGPRIAYGGFQYYSDWPFDEEQGRGIEPEADTAHVRRSVALAESFGAQHIKTRTFRRWDINARMIAEANRRGLRSTGHCAAQLPLIAAGMAAKEHAGMCSTRGAATPYGFNDMLIYDDQVQLYRAADVGVVPTISYFSFAARLAENPKLLEGDTVLASFIVKDEFGWMLNLDAADRARMQRAARDARATALKLVRAGATVGTGTDIWQLPVGVHLELEELVAAGLSTAEAIQAATSSAARITGIDHVLGSIERGKLADVVILDADPLVDIRHTRRISAVVQSGRVVDRTAIRAEFKTAR